MSEIGVFDMVKKDGKPFELVYQHPKFILRALGEAGSQHNFLPSLFQCPMERFISTSFPGVHSVLPLFWCNNKEFDYKNDQCYICNFSDVVTTYYFCQDCDLKYHKECVESFGYIRHPYDLKHLLELKYYDTFDSDKEYLCCRGEKIRKLVYQCTICDIFMHTVCAMKSIPFIVNQPKRHEHSLTFFPRQTSLTCDVCGLLRKSNITYVCLECNFVAHNDCMYSPNIIKISRHHHRISYTSSPPSKHLATTIVFKQWGCGVCHESVDYGAYTCDTCGNYVVHARCALRKDVWDGVELESVPLEEDIILDVQPFKNISEGVILHFLHDHHLRLEVGIFSDENKFCQACGLSIHEGNIYSCVKCDYILHETCAKAHHTIQHVLHPHPLTLMHVSQSNDGYYFCDSCGRYCAGFLYGCPRGGDFCNFTVDIQCASISDPFHCKYHEHPLFLVSRLKENLICQLCKTESINRRLLCCIKCNFILCIGCATLPEKARYKHDKHFLLIKFGKEVSEKDWCEVCERDLGDTNTKVVYRCDHCCTTIHIECLFGGEPYMKPGIIGLPFGKFEVLCKRNISRPICDWCENHCQGNILKRSNLIACSMKCAQQMFE